MSSIDERIVQMKFNQKQFTEGVSQSIASINDLKKSMASLDDMKSAVDGVDFKQLSRNIESTAGLLQTKLSGISGVINTMKTTLVVDATRWLEGRFKSALSDISNITSRIKHTMSDVGDIIMTKFKLDDALAGFSEYEQKIGSIQVIAANTGALSKKTAEELKEITEQERILANDIWTGKVNVNGQARIDYINALNDASITYEGTQRAIDEIMGQSIEKNKKATSTLKDIDEALDNLNVYADKTIYNFAQMTSAIGQFTTQGVNLDDSVLAVKGISNLAAYVGAPASDASRSMFQLAQGLATGYIGLTDWMSLEHTAGMAGSEFQEVLKKTARVHGIAIDDMIASEGSFRNTLKDQWLTSDILLEALEQFESFDQSLYETKGLTDQQIEENSAKLEEIREKWRQRGYTDDQIEEIEELSRVSYEAATKVRTWTNLMDTLKEEIGSSYTMMWQNILGNYEQATDLFSSIHDSISENFINPMAEAREQKWKFWNENGGRAAALEAFSTIANSIIKIVKTLKEGWREVFPPMTGEKLVKISEAFKELSKNLAISSETLDRVKRIAAGAAAAVDIIKNVVVGAVKILTGLISRFFGMFPKSDDKHPILKMIAALGDLLVVVDKAIKEGTWVEKTIAGICNAFSFMWNTIKHFWNLLNDFSVALTGDTITGHILSFIELIKDFAEFTAKAFKNFNWKGTFDGAISSLKSGSVSLVETLKSTFGGASGAYKDGVLSFTRSMRDADKNVDQNSFIFKLGRGIAAAWNVTKKLFTTVFEWTKEAIKKIYDLFVGSDGEVTIDDFLNAFLSVNAVKFIYNVSKFIENLSGFIDSLSDIPEEFAEMLSGVKNSINAYAADLRAEAFIKTAQAIAILAASLWAIALIPADRLWRSVAVFGTLMGVLTGAVVITNLTSGASVISKTAEGIKGNIGGINTTAIVIREFANAMLKMTIAVAALGVIPEDIIEKGVMRITELMTTLGMIITLLSVLPDVSVGSAAALAAFGLAVSLLTAPILVFSVFPIDMLEKGFIVLNKFIESFMMFMVTASLATMSSGYSSISGDLGDNLHKMALALVSLAASITMLTVPFLAIMLVSTIAGEELTARGLSMFNKLIWSITGVIAVLSFVSSTFMHNGESDDIVTLGDNISQIAPAVFALAGAMLVMIPAIVIFAHMSTKDVLVGAAAIGIMVLALGGSIALMSNVGDNIEDVSHVLLAMIGIIALAGVLFSTFDLLGLSAGAVFGMSVGVALIFGAIALMIKALAGKGSDGGDEDDVENSANSLVKKAAAFGIMAASLVGIAFAMKEIVNTFKGLDLIEWLNVIGGVSIVILSIFAIFKLFASGAAINGLTAFSEVAKNLAEAILAIASAFWVFLQAWDQIAASDFSGLGEGITMLFIGLNEGLEAFEDFLDEFLVTVAHTVFKAVDLIVEILLVGLVKILNAVATNIVPIADALLDIVCGILESIASHADRLLMAAWDILVAVWDALWKMAGDNPALFLTAMSAAILKIAGGLAGVKTLITGLVGHLKTLIPLITAHPVVAGIVALAAAGLAVHAAVSKQNAIQEEYRANREAMGQDIYAGYEGYQGQKYLLATSDMRGGETLRSVFKEFGFEGNTIKQAAGMMSQLGIKELHLSSQADLLRQYAKSAGYEGTAGYIQYLKENKTAIQNLNDTAKLINNTFSSNQIETLTKVITTYGSMDDFDEDVNTAYAALIDAVKTGEFNFGSVDEKYRSDMMGIAQNMINLLGVGATEEDILLLANALMNGTNKISGDVEDLIRQAENQARITAYQGIYYREYLAKNLSENEDHSTNVLGKIGYFINMMDKSMADTYNLLGSMDINDPLTAVQVAAESINATVKDIASVQEETLKKYTGEYDIARLAKNWEKFSESGKFASLDEYLEAVGKQYAQGGKGAGYALMSDEFRNSFLYDEYGNYKWAEASTKELFNQLMYQAELYAAQQESERTSKRAIAIAQDTYGEEQSNAGISPEEYQRTVEEGLKKATEPIASETVNELYKTANSTEAKTWGSNITSDISELIGGADGITDNLGDIKGYLGDLSTDGIKSKISNTINLDISGTVSDFKDSVEIPEVEANTLNTRGITSGVSSLFNKAKGNDKVNSVANAVSSIWNN